jgi:hypothetical protein
MLHTSELFLGERLDVDASKPIPDQKTHVDIQRPGNRDQGSPRIQACKPNVTSRTKFDAEGYAKQGMNAAMSTQKPALISGETQMQCGTENKCCS